MRSAVFGVLGVAICYLSCALFAWNFNPGDWGVFLRIWFVCWAIPWGIGGVVLGYQMDEEAKWTKHQRNLAIAERARNVSDGVLDMKRAKAIER